MSAAVSNFANFSNRNFIFTFCLIILFLCSEIRGLLPSSRLRDGCSGAMLYYCWFAHLHIIFVIVNNTLPLLPPLHVVLAAAVVVADAVAVVLWRNLLPSQIFCICNNALAVRNEAREEVKEDKANRRIPPNLPLPLLRTPLTLMHNNFR